MPELPTVHVVKAWPAKGGPAMHVAAFDTDREAQSDRGRREARYPAWRFFVVEASVSY